MKYLDELGMRSKKAAFIMNTLTTQQKNIALSAVADALVSHKKELLEANAPDIENAVKKGTSEAMIDRLRLTEQRIDAMAEGLRQVVDLQDPTGIVLSETTHANGMRIVKETVPFGVIGIIYESRPNVTADAFGLCFKAGNAVILRGGSDALTSNKAIVDIIRDALEAEGMPADAVLLIEKTDRETATEFMKLNRYVDLLIPRGGAGLIKSCVENATIPVIETGTGNCHIYVDESADLDKALPIILNAKTQRMGVCNACESLLVNEKIADSAIPAIYKMLTEAHVEIRTTEDIRKRYANCDGLCEATEDDFYREYLDAIISLAVVGDVQEAISHINRYSTHHSEAIITESKENAELFLNGVDAACVYVNASTRFTDGFEFGYGAEIGISTQKMHARGPMGLPALTSYKYKVYGNGQVRG